jgi:hypothetical protein
MSISGIHVSLSAIGDFISMSPESVICDGQKGTSLKFQLEFDEEPVFDENFIIKIEDREWPMTSGEIELPNDEIFKLFENKTSLDVFLSSDGLEWNIATTKIIQDWLAQCTKNLIKKDDFIQLEMELSGKDWVDCELSIDFEISTINQENYEIITTRKTIDLKLVENNVKIPVERPLGKYLGTKIVINKDEGDFIRNYTTLDKEKSFVLPSRKLIPISEYWGRGRSNITLYAYRMNDDGPERSVKENCKKNVLRKLAREWLETLDLELDDITLNKLHPGKICFKYKLDMSFASSKYDLAELYENEFLNSEFVKLSAELHNEYEFERTQRFILNYNNGKIIGNTILNKKQRKRISKSKHHNISYITWNKKINHTNKNPNLISGLPESFYDQLKELPSTENFPFPQFKHTIVDSNKMIIEFEDGSLCDNMHLQVIGKYSERGNVKGESGLFCNECGALLSHVLNPQNCERCGFDGNTINTETLEFVRLEDDSISVNLTRNFESFILRLTEDHENAVKELRNE